MSNRPESPSACRNCGGGEWVCENHGDRPWDGTSARDDACGCGAGSPCPVCCPEMAFAGRRAATIQACAEIALAAFDWRFGEAPRTYRALANRIGEEIRRLQYASAIEARSDATAQTGAAEGESAVAKPDAPTHSQCSKPREDK